VPAVDEAVETTRVSTLELFFDLVFVFTITQLTSVLVREETPQGLLAIVLMLGVIWWMYGGYAWLTNAVPPDRADRRLLLMVGMAGFLLIALSVPRAFVGGGLTFGIGYLLVTIVHAGLFTRSNVQATVQAVFRIARFNLISALLLLAGGLVGGPGQYILWGLAFVLLASTPFLSRISGFQVKPAHFVERHGLVVIIALGESVVAVGIGLTGQAITVPLALVAILGLGLTAALFWLYFGGDDVRAERALARASAERRPWLALYSYGYAHVPLLLGVVVLAAGVRETIGHAFKPLSPAGALALGGGVFLYLAGDVFFRRTLAISPNTARTLAPAGALATVPLGMAFGAVLQLVVLVRRMVPPSHPGRARQAGGRHEAISDPTIDAYAVEHAASPEHHAKPHQEGPVNRCLQ
jgi:low temperature requirement protein LtrA